MTRLRSKISLMASGFALGMFSSCCATTAILIYRIDVAKGGLVRKNETMAFEKSNGMYCATPGGMKRITEKIDYCNRFCK
jgi:hypothetical protein